MCGIAGIFHSGKATGHDLRRLGAAMTERLVHRGPDDGDVWLDQDAGIVLGHRRLSIVDLSSAGHQPMASGSGRFVISYNGEIYNSEDLRKDLRPHGVHFRGHSDTETILEACAHWGVEDTASRLIGMFAFALWDRQAQRLWIVRDRLGIKPLYWTQSASNTVLFASELKALRVHPECPTEVDRNAVAGFLRHNYVPSPLSILRGVNKLPPGHILCVDTPLSLPEIKPFWTMDDIVQRTAETPFSGTDGEALEALDSLLGDAVERRMAADVPLGAFLSGGIDSSTVVALMQSRSSRPVRSFSIGFEEAGYNEAEHAKTIAQHLQTDHTQLYVTPDDARAVIPKLPQIYDEPFSDSSQIPTYLVSQMTRDYVTVALSGDGGDELFGGYTRYVIARRIGRLLQSIPRPARAAAAAAIRSLPPAAWDAAFKLIPISKRPVHAGDRMHKLSSVLTSDQDDFYRRLISHWTEPDDIVVNGQEPTSVIWDPAVKERVPDFTQRMQYLDTLAYLPDDILTKVDRASMAVSLEVRVPVLDHRLVEFAWSLPQSMKYRDGQGKWLLRRLLYQYVPQDLVDRPKMGFGVPIGSWLRGPLNEWANDLLSEATFKKHGLLHREPVIQKWHEHQSGERNWQYLLWDVLMLHAWAEEWS